MSRSVLHYKQVLEWADAHHERTGKWPSTYSGQVWEAVDEKWANIDQALRVGLRGFRGGSSLTRLLAKRRGKRNRKDLPRYTLRQILAWADTHHRRTGRWPTSNAGPISSAKGETWMAVNMALSHGQRGLRGGSSLAELLAKRRGVRKQTHLPRLSVKEILAWADEHRRRTGNWPKAESGPIRDAPGETWLAVDKALKKGARGLRTQSSLFKLLAKYRGVKRHRRQPPLSEDQILKWADAHYRRTKRWPSESSGPLRGTNGETWCKIQAALREGRRGLAGGTTITELLAQYGRVRHRLYLPRLTKKQILKWADAYFARHQCWPSRSSGPIPDSDGETWFAVDSALKKGGRGLRGGTSLARLLAPRKKS